LGSGRLGLALGYGPLALGFPLLHRSGARRCGRGWRRHGLGNIGFPGKAAQAGQPDGIGVEIHVGAQRDDGVDRQLLFEMSHPLAVNQAAVHDENFDHAFVHGLDHLIDEFIEDRALVPPAGNYAGRHHKEEVQLAVDVDQAHQFVAAVLLIALVPEIDCIGVDRVVVFVEPEQIRIFVVLVIGDEQIGRISDKESLGVKQAERP
jgi:hypothetical protein